MVENNILSGLLKIQLEKSPAGILKVFHKDDVKIIKDGSIEVNKDEMEALKDIEG